MTLRDRALALVARIGRDKAYHLGAGAAFGLLGAVWGAALAGAGGPPAFFGGLTLAAVAGLGKELFDSAFGGTVDPWDVAYTAAGGLVPGLVVALLA